MAESEETVAASGRKAGLRAAVALLVFGLLVAAIFVIDPDGFYLWAKAIHVIAVISWMAGMLYLPRLFIYHCEADKGSAQSETFKVMERRLLRMIINPAMTVTWVFGLWLAWHAGVYFELWFLVKFACVLVLSGVHGHFSAAVRAFDEDRNDKTQRYWRMINEVPTVLMIVIVVMVIVRPF